jgi:hypothetical protein
MLAFTRHAVACRPGRGYERKQGKSKICFPGYNAMYFVESQSTFRRALLTTCFHADFLLGLFSDSEDRGDLFRRKVL